ncbi:MAG: hypothetical protein FGM27_05860 [Candidatus Omnitrophica bacterium]|nr:hypothetical protein [Candidatus Omnitrophota bacterium]
MDKRFWLNTVIRLVSAAGIFFSITVVHADIPAYQSRFFLARGDRAKALGFADKAYDLGRRTPDFLSHRAEMLSAEADSKKTEEDYARAARAYEELSLKLPFLGKPGVLAAVYKSRELNRRRELNQETWGSLEKSILDFQKMQPGNLWTAFAAGREILVHRQFSNPQSQDQAWRLIRSAAQEVPERYLEQAIALTIRERLPAKVLDGLIAPRYETYKQASEYLKKNRFWVHWARVYPELLVFRGATADVLSKSGDFHLLRGEMTLAYESYRQALGIDASAVRASVGLALSSFYLQKKPFGSAEKALENALEENIPLGALAAVLAAEKKLSLGPYARGLLLYRKGQFQEAADQLKRAGGGGKYAVYFLCEAMRSAGFGGEAAVILKSRFIERTATLRELILLESMSPELAAEVRMRLQEQALKHKTFRSWRDSQAEKRYLLEGESSGVLLTLLPGKNRIQVAAKLRHDSGRDAAGLLFRIAGKAAASAVTSSQGSRVKFEISTAGGPFWLSCERLQGGGEVPDSSQVELGDLAVIPIGEEAGVPHG